MDFFVEHSDAVLNPVLAAVIALGAIHDCVNDKNLTFFKMIVVLLGSTVLTAVGLLSLLGHISRAWDSVSMSAVLGFVIMLQSAGKHLVIPQKQRANKLWIVLGGLMILKSVHDTLAIVY